MKSNRRDFLKTATVAGAGAFAGGIFSGCAPKQPESNLAEFLNLLRNFILRNLICQDMQLLHFRL